MQSDRIGKIGAAAVKEVRRCLNWQEKTEKREGCRGEHMRRSKGWERAVVGRWR